MEEPDISAQRSLRRLGAFAKKKLGQNFLENRSDLVSIAGTLQLGTQDEILEIGPGLGALTEELLRSGGRVTAIEKDRQMIAHLKQHLPSDALHIVEADILSVNISRDIKPAKRMKVAGNIPYNITSPILFWILEQGEHISEAVLTVQKELAERLCATPGGRIWGALSVMVQAQASVQIVRRIPRGHFYPVPNVDSAVVHMTLLDKPAFDLTDRAAFSYCVAKAFQKRRKMLLNALESEEIGWGKERLTQAFTELGIDPKRRPETLSVVEWSRLASRLGNPHQS